MPALASSRLVPAWRATHAASSVTLVSSRASVTLRIVTSTELIRPPTPAVSVTVTVGLRDARQKAGLVGAGQSTFTGTGEGVIVSTMWAAVGGGEATGRQAGLLQLPDVPRGRELPQRRLEVADVGQARLLQGGPTGALH